MVLLLISTLALSRGSLLYAAFAGFQIFSLTVAIAALRYKIPLLHRVAAPASALLVLKAAAVAGLYRFLFTRGPLWKIWNSNTAAAGTANPNTGNSALPEPNTAAANDRV
jgi:hypothetical protein